MGSLPSYDHSRCVPIPEEFIDYQNPWAIAAMAVASLGQSYVICSLSFAEKESITARDIMLRSLVEVHKCFRGVFCVL
jgi:hypothetical protein